MKRKTNFIGNIAIVCGIVSWVLSIFDLVLNGNWVGIIILTLMILYTHFRDEYLVLRKKEIDEIIENEKSR